MKVVFWGNMYLLFFLILSATYYCCYWYAWCDHPFLLFNLLHAKETRCSSIMDLFVEQEYRLAVKAWRSFEKKMHNFITSLLRAQWNFKYQASQMYSKRWVNIVFVGTSFCYRKNYLLLVIITIYCIIFQALLSVIYINFKIMQK